MTHKHTNTHTHTRTHFFPFSLSLSLSFSLSFSLLHTHMHATHSHAHTHTRIHTRWGEWTGQQQRSIDGHTSDGSCVFACYCCTTAWWALSCIGRWDASRIRPDVRRGSGGAEDQMREAHLLDDKTDIHTHNSTFSLFSSHANSQTHTHTYIHTHTHAQTHALAHSLSYTRKYTQTHTKTRTQTHAQHTVCVPLFY